MQIQVAGLIQAYSARGEGIPLLFIHGYPLNRSLWEPQIDSLSKIACCIAPDLRGFGETPLPAAGPVAPEALSMELYADDCLQLLDALNITRPIVVAGLSMGGYIALSFYRKYQQRVAGLVLMATRADADTPEGRQKRDETINIARAEGTQAISSMMLPKMMAPITYKTKPELVSRVAKMMGGATVPGIIGSLQAMKSRSDSSSLLTSIAHPTLILHGIDDQLISSVEAETMAAAIPQAYLELVPAAGHLPNLEQPELTNHHLSQFITRLNVSI